MLKKWIIMIGIILAIVGLCVAENVYIQKSFLFLENSLNEIETSFNKNTETINTEENIEQINNLHESWQEKTKVLKTIVWHTGIKEVEVNLSRIISYAEQNNYEEAMVELHQLQDFCRHYRNDFKITVENIF